MSLLESEHSFDGRRDGRGHSISFVRWATIRVEHGGEVDGIMAMVRVRVYRTGEALGARTSPVAQTRLVLYEAFEQVIATGASCARS
jgi:hypothetical protein